MALMDNPQNLLMGEDIDGVGGCGGSCDCDDCEVNHTQISADMAIGAGLGNIAQMASGLGAAWDQFDPLQGAVYTTQAQSINPGYSWSDVFKQGAGVGFQVFRDMFGGPRPGTFITNGPGGSSFQRLPEGGANANLGFNLGLHPGGVGMGAGNTNFTTLLILGVVGFVVLKSVSK